MESRRVISVVEAKDQVHSLVVISVIPSMLKSGQLKSGMEWLLRSVKNNW